MASKMDRNRGRSAIAKTVPRFCRWHEKRRSPPQVELNSPEEGRGGFQGSGPRGPRRFSPETAMSQDITLTVDYHDRVCVIRRFDHGTRPRPGIHRGAHDHGGSQADGRAGPPGGGPRGPRRPGSRRAPPAGPASRTCSATASSSAWPTSCRCRCRPRRRRRKTDKVDTARIQREHLNGSLPLAYQPPRRNGVSSAAWWPTARTWSTGARRCGTGSTATWPTRPGWTARACGRQGANSGCGPC